MNKIECRITAKIIKQLSLFLMLHGVNNYTLSFSAGEEDVTFTVVVDRLKEDLIGRMKEKIGKQREIEVEIYGWELLGDTDAQTELDVLGVLIDRIDVQQKDHKTVITLTRRQQTKAG